ncbi:MAG: hypothetical protein ACREQQ_04815, partial [Candidatus Binatia bacterium]
SAQEALEAASIAGAEFAAAACAAALDSSAEAVESACEGLSRDSHFIEDRGLAIWPDGTMGGRYAFRHSLYQEVLRARVPSARRARFARRIAERLESAYRERTEEIAAELASHFADAALPEREIEARLLAAERARRVAAPSEARAHASRGLALLETLPAGLPRDRLEFGFVLVLAECAYSEHGHGGNDLRAMLDRLGELLEAAPDSAALYRAGFALDVTDLYGARLQQMIDSSLRTAEIFRERTTPAFECHARALAGHAYFSMGRHLEAASHLAGCEELIGKIASDPPQALVPADPITIYHAVTAFVDWILGYADRAAMHSQKVLERAEEVGNAHFRGWAPVAATFLRLFRREPRAVVEMARSGIEFCTSHGEPGWAAMLTKHMQIARCMLGEVADALPIFRRIAAAERAAGAMLWMPFDCALEAEVCVADGRLPEAHAALTAGFAEVERSENRSFEPELHRVLGDCALADGDAEAAERSFRTALDLARSQHARALELRAAIALGSLFRSQRRERLVREALAPVYEAFTEGFDTPDLREAKRLLEATKPRRKV